MWYIHYYLMIRSEGGCSDTDHFAEELSIMICHEAVFWENVVIHILN